MNSSNPITRAVARLRPTLGRWRHRSRILGAIVLLTFFGIAQRVLPMPRWSNVLGRAEAIPDAWLGKKIDRLPVRSASHAESRVANAILRASRILPWEPTCLAQAAAGQCLLRLNKSPGVVVIGLRRTDPEMKTHWDAHAWLLGRRGALTGGPAASGFTATTVYEVANGLRAVDVDLVIPPRSN